MRRHSLVLALILFLLSTVPAPAGAAETSAGQWLIPPVDGPIVRGFETTASAYSKGHRGVDFASPPGTAVRAAGEGVVAFAGDVAGVLAVTIEHPDGLRSTYSSLSEVSVEEGQQVTAGTWVGRVGESHPADGVNLHFGVKVEGVYVNPEAHLGPLDASGAIRLEALETSASAGSRAHQACPETRPNVAPNENIAVAVAGIGSRTEGGVSADMYERGPELLGYPSGSIYNFSYAGADGPGFHEPYATSDTFDDLDEAAKRLEAQLRSIALEHPGRSVDLIAHSQGGVVARTYLAKVARAWDPDLPRVENLVTFSSPHRGAPLAGISAALHDSVIGRPALWALGGLSDLLGGVLPNPGSEAVLDLAPHSELMDELGAQDIAYGTRALALGTAGDLVVPADRAALPEETSRWVEADGWNKHSGIVGSESSLAAAHAFLRGAPECLDARDDVPALGFLVGGAQWGVGRFLDAAVSSPWDSFLGP